MHNSTNIGSYNSTKMHLNNFRISVRLINQSSLQVGSNLLQNTRYHTYLVQLSTRRLVMPRNLQTTPPALLCGTLHVVVEEMVRRRGRAQELPQHLALDRGNLHILHRWDRVQLGLQLLEVLQLKRRRHVGVQQRLWLVLPRFESDVGFRWLFLYFRVLVVFAFLLRVLLRCTLKNSLISRRRDLWDNSEITCGRCSW